MRKFFLFLLLLMILSFSSNCSEGFVIPKPVCDYGTSICETLTILCTNHSSNPEKNSLPPELILYLREVDSTLSTYK